MTLDPEDIEAIAQRVVELQRLAAPLGQRLATAEEVAAELGVSTDWVYEHGEQLGRVKLGSARNAPVRFDLQRVRQISREVEVDGSSPATGPQKRRTRRKRRTEDAGSFPLLSPRVTK